VRLRIHADDYGLSQGVNRGILEALDADVLDGTSVLVHLGTPDDHTALAQRPGTKGLHFAVGAAGGGTGDPLLAGFRLGLREAEARLRADLARFEALYGRPPDHLDSHQHVHVLQPAVRLAFRKVAKEKGLPVRWPYEPEGRSFKARTLALLSRRLARPGHRFMGLDWMGDLQEAQVVARLRQLENAGTQRVEWMVHPGYVEDHPTWDAFTGGREAELRALIAMGPALGAWR